MNQLTCRAELELTHLHEYLHLIVDRLASFESSVDQQPDGVGFTFPFGSAFLGTPPDALVMELAANDVDGLQRVRELITVAVQLYAKREEPKIVWKGDLAGEHKLVTFRKVRVVRSQCITPHMQRVRLGGDNLERFQLFGGMHVRMFFPTPANPEPVWPVAGPDGLQHWPDAARKPQARVYTIRHLDVEAGFMDVDMVVHGEHGGENGIGSCWAQTAAPGDEVGLIGPLGRPVREADWYVMGCDETGLPAVSRILETLPANTRGVVFIEIADAAEQQAINHPDGFDVHWIHRDGVRAGEHPELVARLKQIVWPENVLTFGFFAGEGEQARELRDYWRKDLSYGREKAIIAGYWRRGVAGVMAG